MNYIKVYNSLVTSRKNKGRVKNREVYYENHHIYPRSLFRELEKDPNNLVLLTPREHYIAHWLLFKIYPGKAMLYAFINMCSKASSRPLARNYRVNSKAYEKARVLFSINNPARGKEAREKISAAKKGKNHHYYGVPTTESIHFNPEIFTIIHKNGNIFSGTRYDMYGKLGLNKSQVSELVNRKAFSTGGWRLKGAPIHVRAVVYGKTRYCWYNIHTGFGYVCTKHEFITLTNFKQSSTNHLIYKTRNSCYGWTVDKLKEQK